MKAFVGDVFNYLWGANPVLLCTVCVARDPLQYSITFSKNTQLFSPVVSRRAWTEQLPTDKTIRVFLGRLQTEEISPLTVIRRSTPNTTVLWRYPPPLSEYFLRRHVVATRNDWINTDRTRIEEARRRSMQRIEVEDRSLRTTVAMVLEVKVEIGTNQSGVRGESRSWHKPIYCSR